MVDPTLVDRPPAGDRWVHEIKWDGYRGQAHLGPSGVQLFTRRGNDWTEKFEPIAIAAGALRARSVILDGEIVALGADGRSDFHALRRELGRPKPRIVYQVFDLLWQDGEDLRPRPLAERKARLRALLAGADPALVLVDGVEGAGGAVLESACRLQVEGIVSKALDAPYRAGRSRDWLKTKCAVSETLAVVGFYRDDNGRLDGLFLGRAIDDGRWAYAGEVQNGLASEDLARLAEELPALKVTKAPLVEKPKGKSGAVWTRPAVLVEIEYPNKAGDGRIRHPRFKGFRDDLLPRPKKTP